MSVSEAQKKASRKWNEGNLERIYITVKKGQKDRIRQAADTCGESINQFIQKAVESRMSRT